jgi:competence protein ComEA
VASHDDRRAAILLLALAFAGVVVRFAVGGAAAPGAVGYREAGGERPGQDSVAAQSIRLARPLGSDERIDVDRANVHDLTRLPRIGPALAARIVADREVHGAFGSLERLDRVPGVGPSLLEAVRRHVTFSGRARPVRAGDRAPRVRVNQASEEELARLPGIGPVRARDIVDDRRRRGPFRNIDDLQRVPGIGPSTVERLKERVRIP